MSTKVMLPNNGNRLVLGALLFVSAAAVMMNTQPLTVVVGASAATTPNATFMNCFVDATMEGLATSHAQVPTGNYKAIPAHTEGDAAVNFCADYCIPRGARFMGITHGAICSCGVTNASLTVAARSQCNTCANGGCGGDGYVSVYNLSAPVCSADTPADGYVRFGNSCFRYEVNGSKALNWTAAQAQCEREGAVLASIRNEAENQFVLSFPAVSGNGVSDRIMWSGGVYYGQGNSFEWADGTPVTYTNWRPGEPTSATTSFESCVEVFSNYPTPFKGSWNDQTCSVAHRYVCEKPAPGAPQENYTPEIEMIQVGTTTACVPSASVHVNSDPSLQLWLKLDTADVDAQTRVILDASPYARNGTVSGTIAFVNNPTTYSQALSFDGSVSIAMPAWDTPTDVLSVSAWVRSNLTLTPPARTVIISKPIRNGSSTVGSNLDYAWALVVENGNVYCFIVLNQKVCTTEGAAGAATPNVWQFVVGIWDGTQLHIYVNGAQAALLTVTAGALPFPHNTFPVKVGGGASAAVQFAGSLDDVRVYSEVLTIADIQYLYTCALRPHSSDRLSAYAGAPLTLYLLGHNVRPDQRVGISTTNCNDATFIIPPVFIKTMSPARGTVSFPANDFVTPADGSAYYTLCVATPQNPKAFAASLGIRLYVAKLTAVNGNLRDVIATPDSGDFATTLTITGSGIIDGQTLLLSPFPTCQSYYGLISATLYNVSSIGDRGLAFIGHSVVPTNVLYICWAPSRGNAIALQFVSPTKLSVQLTGSRYNFKRMISNDGTLQVTASLMTNGYAPPSGSTSQNVVLPCGDLQPNGTTSYFLQVSMGSYVDYLIPAPGASLCDVMTGVNIYANGALLRKYFYSRTSPLSVTYDGTAMQVPAPSWGYFGGSASGFPTDGRTSLTEWGSYYSANLGGCCQASPHQSSTWGLPYTVNAMAYDTSRVFFNLVNKPRLAFPDQRFAVAAQVVDATGTAISGLGARCTIVVVQDTVVVYNKTDDTCLLNFMTTLSGTEDHFLISVTILSGPFTLSGANSKTFIVAAARLPYEGTPLQGGNITEYLIFSNSTDATIYPTYVTSYTELFPRGSATLTPIQDQPMSAFDYTRRPAVEYAWTWQQAYLTSGQLFGSGMKANGIRYMAFALYSATTQTVGGMAGCGTVCPTYVRMYIDGVAVEGSMQLTVGWHQVIVFIATRVALGPNDGIYFRFDAAGLAVNEEIPFGAPPGSQPTDPNVPFGSLLALRANPIATDSFGGSDLPGGADEETAAPVADNTFKLVDAGTTDASFALQQSPNCTSGCVSASYFAFGLFATSAGRMAFTIPDPQGPVRVLLGGNVIAETTGDGSSDLIAATAVPAGWSQVLIKAGVTNAPWAFAIKVSSIVDTVLFYAPQVPAALPSDVADFAAGPMLEMLALSAEGSMTYGIPFNTSNPAAPAATNVQFTDIDVTQTPRAGRTTTVQSIPFEWMPEESKDAAGNFGASSADGGGYNRYYSFALYSSVAARSINLTLGHLDGAAAWMDGTFIGGALSNSPAQGTLLTLTNVAQGYHRIILRLQALNSLTFIPVSSVSHSAAKSVCTSRGFDLCKSIAAICPLSGPRPDLGIPFAGSAWAAVERDSDWIQIGRGTTAEATCGTVVGDSGFPDTAVPFTTYAACCGGRPAASLSVTLQGASDNAVVGYANQVAEPPIPPPTIDTVQGSNGVTVTLSLPAGYPNAKILYTYSPTTFPNMVYSSALLVQTAAIIRAVVVDGRDYSVVVEQVVSAASDILLTRSQCVSGADCLVQLSRADGFTSDLRSKLFVVVNADATADLATVLDSSAAVQQRNPSTATFTGFLSVDAYGVVRIPGTTGPLSTASSLAVVEYPPGADRSAVPGARLSQTLSVAELVVTAAGGGAFVPTPASTAYIVGGFIGGDGIIFPQLADPALLPPNTGACTVEGCAALGKQALNNRQIITWLFTQTDAYVNINASAARGQTINCGCVIAVGAIVVPGSSFPSYITNPTLVTLRSGPYINNLPPVSTGDIIYGAGPSRVHVGDTVTLYGSFSGSASDYTVRLSGALGASRIRGTFPVVSVTQSQVVIRSNAAAGMQGVFRVDLVRGGQTVATASGYGMSSIYFLPPQPTITAANGACASDATQCVNGSILELIGSNFNVDDISLNLVVLLDPATGLPSDTITCTTYEAPNDIPGPRTTSERLTCRLNFARPPAPNTALDVVVQILAFPYTAGTEPPRVYQDTHGSLLLGRSSGAGWSGRLAPPPSTDAPAGPSSGPSHTPIIVGAACGIVILILITVLAVLFMKFKIVPKPSHDAGMSDIENALVNGEEPYVPVQSSETGDHNVAAAPPAPGHTEVSHM